ncbi:hypothetical protein BGZ54_005680 [Gamsiella multidivaricata]|nr:hypothetical protein BGZ54_005680 [Gamsiella multidivaricata]
MRYERTTVKDLVDRLEVPPTPLSDIDSEDTVKVYGEDKVWELFDNPTGLDDPGIIPFDSVEHLQAVDNLYATLNAAIKSIATRGGTSFIIHAVAFFPELKLRPDKEISGARGNGAVYYDVQCRADSSSIVAVTCAQVFSCAVAQNMVQLDTTLLSRKCKFEDGADDDSTTAVSHGVASTAVRWQFIQRTIEK